MKKVFVIVGTVHTAGGHGDPGGAMVALLDSRVFLTAEQAQEAVKFVVDQTYFATDVRVEEMVVVR